jgi:hypothetical protein
MAITGSLAVLPVDNMPVLAQQLVRLLGQFFSSIMSAITMSEPDDRPHLAEQFSGSLRDDCAGRDLRNGTMIEGSQLFNTESSDR